MPKDALKPFAVRQTAEQALAVASDLAVIHRQPYLVVQVVAGFELDITVVPTHYPNEAGIAPAQVDDALAKAVAKDQDQDF